MKATWTRRVGFAASAVVCSAACAQQAQRLTWYALLYASNPDYIEVQISTRQLKKNEVSRAVTGNVDVFDASNKRLGQLPFNFTDGSRPALAPGGLYRKFFPQPYRSATRVRGRELFDQTSALGAKFDTAGMRPSDVPIIEPAGPESEGAPPARQ